MKQKITIYTQAIKYCFEHKFAIHNSSIKFSTDSTQTIIDICEQEVEIEIPDNCEDNLVEFEVKELEKVRDKIKADAVVAVNNIEDKIQSLLSIENKQGE
tara:strand:+ start:3151 stop:3450 length:300 start_codon:yes stop_codon:yes gene_type:complete